MITTATAATLRAGLLNGVHQPADVYKAALIKTGHVGDFDAATANYSALGTDEVPNGAGYTTGGQVLTGRDLVEDGDVTILDFSNPTWDPATIAADGMLLYNSTRGGAALAVVAFSNAPVVSTNGPFVGALPAPTAVTGVVRLGTGA